MTEPKTWKNRPEQPSSVKQMTMKRRTYIYEQMMIQTAARQKAKVKEHQQ